MRIVFRADASVQIGTGHVMRCLTLADALCKRGAESLFICRPYHGHLLDLIVQRGHKAISLPAQTEGVKLTPDDRSHSALIGADWTNDAQDTCHALGDTTVDWVVVDHYALDSRWEQALRPRCKRLMVIDDLADRSHDCDLLLDQNLGRTAEDYIGLLPTHTAILVGPQFALLRPEFAQLRPESLVRREHPQIKQLLVTMGGMDKDNATGRVLDVLAACSLPGDVQITVIMGAHAPWLQQIQAQASQMNRPTQVLVGISDMAKVMADSDLAIGAAGSTSWERCCLGLPTIQVVLAENQLVGALALAAGSAATLIGGPEEIATQLKPTLAELLFSDGLRHMSHASACVSDGLGTERVADLVIEEA